MVQSPNKKRQLRQSLWMGASVTVFLLIIWSLGLFNRQQQRLTNIYFTPSQTSNSIAIIAIDDASLAAYGRSPTEWSRTVYAELIEIISESTARVIAFDIIFSEDEPEDEAVASAMSAARQSDNRTRFVIAAAGVQTPQQTTSDENFPRAIHFQNQLLPVDSLLSTADYLGYVNTFADNDGIIRRQPSIVTIDDQNNLSFALATYLAYLRIPSAAAAQVISQQNDTITVAERSFFVDENGFWLQNYFGPSSFEATRTFDVYSFVDVVEGNTDLTTFDDKIILIGLMDSTSATDRFAVPINSNGQLMAGVEIQANALETLIQDSVLSPQSPVSQVASIIIIALLASISYTYIRWYFKLVVAGLWIIGWGLVAFALFDLQRVVINLFHPSLAIVIPLIIAIGLDINREIQSRQNAEFILESVVQASGQRLELSRIVELIAKDVHRLFPNASGEIWTLRESNNIATTWVAYAWGKNATGQSTTANTLIAQAVERQLPQQLDHLAAIPFVWQKRVTAVCLIFMNTSQRIASQRWQLLNSLSKQLAPNIENAILYRETQRQKRTLEAILEGSPAGICVLDADLELLRVNSAFVNLGYDTANPKSNLIDVLGILDVHESQVSALQETFAVGKTFKYELPIQGRTFNMVAAPINQFGQWVVVLADVTQLVELSQLKTRMIRMASHDLKNPLSRILGYGDLALMDDELSPETTKFINYIMQSGQEMNEIIVDILDMEQLRAGRTVFEEFDFAKLTREVIYRHEPDMTRKNQHFISDVSDTIMLKGDYRQMAQVISNLLSNAIKYTPENGEISVRLISNGKQARLEIEDNGYGIAKDAQEKLFTEFYRVKTKDTARIAGTGLGLSLVKTVVDSHDGRVWVESEEGVGSTFFVEIPCYEP